MNKIKIEINVFDPNGVSVSLGKLNSKKVESCLFPLKDFSAYYFMFYRFLIEKVYPASGVRNLKLYDTIYK